MPGPMPSRRQFLLAMGMGLVGVACGGGGSGSIRPTAPAPPSGSIDALAAGASPLSVLGTGADSPPMNPGTNRLGFDLITQKNEVLQGGSVEVWVATDPAGTATGPATGTWHPFTAYAKTGDHSPKSDLPGAYAADLGFPRAGNWTVGVVARQGSARMAGTGIVQVTDGHVIAALGSKAISTPTPVATTVGKLEEICTRNPVCDMHYVSLDRAIASGKPTVVTFGTPLLCMSRLCGPVVDETLLAYRESGREKANFLHVEEFLPGPSRTPPPATPENFSPAFKAWGFETEPWTLVIDRTGIIRFRALGPVTAPELLAALRGLS